MELEIDGRKVKVIIIRKNNKNIYFRFNENLELVITCNKRISIKEIEGLIKKNLKAIERLYKNSLKREVKEKEFWYLGNKYEVIYGCPDIMFQEGKLYIKDEGTLNKFLKEQTKDIFNWEVNKLREIIKTPYFTLKIRKMKTRWGVCNYKTMTITLNSELIKYQKELLRYVIIHEMCHFYHHNHGQLFWEMVRVYYPNYKWARKELRS